MNKVLSPCRAIYKLVRKAPVSVPLVPVMGGNLVTSSRQNHNEPPPGTGATDPSLLEKARKTPDRMTQEDWREVLSSVQYQVHQLEGI